MINLTSFEVSMVCGGCNCVCSVPSPQPTSWIFKCCPCLSPTSQMQGMGIDPTLLEKQKQIGVAADMGACAALCTQNGWKFQSCI